MSNDLLTDVRNFSTGEGETSFVGQPSPPREPPILWTFKVIDTYYDGVVEDKLEDAFYPSRVAYRSWAACIAAAARTMDGEAEDLRSNGDGEDEVAMAEDYDDAAVDIRALPEPEEGEYRYVIDGQDLVVFFYNMTLED